MKIKRVKSKIDGKGKEKSLQERIIYFKNIKFLGSTSYTDVYPHNQVLRADRTVHTIRQFNESYNFDVFIDP